MGCNIRMPDKTIWDVREPKAVCRPISTVVNHTGITIDFKIHETSGVVELLNVPGDEK